MTDPMYIYFIVGTAISVMLMAWPINWEDI